MKINALLDVDVVAVESEDTVTVMLELTAPERPDGEQRAPGALQVVLDRSGSMDGPPLEAAKQALEALVTRLDPTDRFGLVAFDETVGVVVPAQPLTDKEAVKQAIRDLHAGSTTNLSGGLLRGIQEARDGGRNATLLLVSDGHANVGITDADQLAGAARSAQGHGVATSTIGVGLGYDEALLSAIARGGTGNHRFAEDGDAGAAALAAEVEGLLDQVVQAATLTIRPTSDVETVVLHNDLPSDAVEDRIVVELGDFYAAETRKLVIGFGVPVMAALGLASVAELELRWVDVQTLDTHTVTLPVSVNVVPGDQAAGRIPDPVVRTELAFQRAQRAKRAAADALRQGDIGQAVDSFDAACADLGAAAAAAPPAMAAELEEEQRLLRDMSARAHHEAAYLSKQAESDSHLKNRKRGR
jgi:Ca-activated chloride channel family protein